MTSELKENVPIPEILPILPVRGTIVYPLTVVPLTLGQSRSIRLIDEVTIGDRLLGIVSSKGSEQEPKPAQLYQIGTFARLQRFVKSADGSLHIVVRGLERIKIRKWVTEEPYLKAEVEALPDIHPNPDDREAEAHARNLATIWGKALGLASDSSEQVLISLGRDLDLRQLVYLVAGSLPMDVSQAQAILEQDPITDKIKRLSSIVTREVEVMELGKKIQTQTQSEIGKSQREYYLREQIKAIQKELGEGQDQTIEELKSKIELSGMSEEAHKEALRELNRLSQLTSASAEYAVIHTYLEWLTSLPWNTTTQDMLDLDRAMAILDQDHYGLEKIKSRIIEYLAVRKLRAERGVQLADDSSPRDLIRAEREGVILCFVGPPGVGKTSLGQSIARALERKFTHMSLGGMRDEAEIRGHRRTYIGAMPGRIIQALKRCGSKNPIMMLDEVDKIGIDWRGDPSSALLEVLDPEQNREFRDHYLDVAFDLSQVMFVATANVIENVPVALRDRMEILELAGYTDDEKLHIAKRYLFPRALRETGLKAGELQISDEAIKKIINNYTREAGVRELGRQLTAIARKMATSIAKHQAPIPILDAQHVEQHLGRPRYFYEAAERTEIPGVATGLAITASGGEILFIEATRMPGDKAFTITGQLGDVMKESAHAALSYVRSRATQFGIEPTFFEKSDLHIHIPAGSIPKDGPSAGVTIATAITSLLTGRTVRSEVGMTGEVTLRGKVLAVGGIEEKVLAAHRAGLRTVILPKRNEKDTAELAAQVRKEMNFIYVDTVDEVLKHALHAPIVAKRAANA